MIWWQNTNVTEPPLTCNLTDTGIDVLIKSKEKKIFEQLPCHTQAVKRCVKLVTEASSSVCGSNSKHCFIRAKIESRQKMPSFETKSQFHV